MAGNPSLIVVLVDITHDEVSNTWLDVPPLDALCKELCEKVCAALGEPDNSSFTALMTNHIDSIYIKPTAALSSLAYFLTSLNVRTVITIGDNSAMEDDWVLQKAADKQVQSPVAFCNIEAEMLEVEGPKRRNIWISLTEPRSKKDSWLVLTLTALSGKSLHEVMTWKSQQTVEEESKELSVESCYTPSGESEPEAVKTAAQWRQEFIDFLRQERLPAVPGAPADQYDSDELAAVLLKGTALMFSKVAKKLAEVLPNLNPGKPLSLDSLEQVLSQVQFPVMPDCPSADAVNSVNFSKQATALRDGYDRMNAALAQGLEALGAIHEEFIPPNLTLEFRLDSFGAYSVYLVNASAASAQDVAVRYLNTLGQEVQRYQGLEVPANGVLECLSSAYLDEWKRSGLQRIEVLGSEVSLAVA